jgi:hypothetical protein
MLQQLQSFISDHQLVIPSDKTDLIQQLRIAKVKQNMNLDKEYQSLDLIDSTRLALNGVIRS